MSDETQWRQVDDYYWSGPDGYTICRVGMAAGDRFELWHDGAAVGHGKTLASAKKTYEGLASGRPTGRRVYSG